MSRQFLCFACITSLCFFAHSALAQDSKSALSADVFMAPKPLVRDQPIYPSVALSRGFEGWVVVSFVISKNGRPSDLMIENSSGGKAFEKAAEAAVAGWHYEPALLNGQPVDASMSHVRVVFAIKDLPKGARPQFVDDFNGINRDIKAGKLDRAAKLLAELRNGERTNLYEDAWYWWLDYNYLKAKGDAEDAELIDALQHAIAGDFLAPDVIVVAAVRLFALEYKTLDFSSAIDTYSDLRDSKAAQQSQYYKKVMAGLAATVSDIDKLIASDKILAVNGRIDEHDYWDHTLLRNSFSLEKIHGAVDRVEIRCSRGYVRYRFKTNAENKRWTMPDDLGDCGVYVRGDPGTTFVFYAYPNSQ